MKEDKIKNEAQIHIHICEPSRRENMSGLDYPMIEEIEEELRNLFRNWQIDGVDIFNELTGNVLAIDQICPYCGEEFPRTKNIHNHLKHCEG